MTDIKKENYSKKVKETVDEDGRLIEIYWKYRLEGAPVVDMVFESFAEIIKKGWANHNVAIDNQNRVVWAVYPDTGEIAGGIAYKYLENANSFWISLSFTNPKYRGRGINSMCHEILENDARKLGVTSIESYVHVDNLPRLKSTMKVGLEPKFYRMYKKLN